MVLSVGRRDHLGGTTTLAFIEVCGQREFAHVVVHKLFTYQMLWFS